MRKSSTKMLLVLTGSLCTMSFVPGCAHMEQAPPERATGYGFIHKSLPEASRKVDEARAAGKENQCPAEFKAAKDTVDEAYKIYLKDPWQTQGLDMAQDGINKLNALCPVAVAPEPPPPAPKQSKVMVFDEVALFDTDKAELKPGGKERIKAYREEARAAFSRADKIKITGHTDNTGSYDYNVRLSLRRAEAVRTYLISIGVDPSKLEVSGAGESKPVADNSTMEGRAKNRRVEVDILGLEK
jgi:OOP family OmpA-OmpF porin